MILARVLRWLIAALVLAGTPALAQKAGRFETIAAFETTAIAPPRITIWLPPGYDAGRGRYPTVYMHDGQNLFDRRRSNFDKVWAADKAALRLIAARRVRPFIIVGIDQPGPARWRQYFPQALMDRASPALRDALTRTTGNAIIAERAPLTGDAYLRFLALELKPYIDRTYRTRPAARDTAIVGSSMGGLISCYAYTRLPRVFGRAGCVSTHWPLGDPEATAPHRAEIVALWAQEFARRRPGDGGRLWMDHGDQTLDAFYPPYQAGVTAALRRAGWREGRDFVARAYPGTPHEENAWAARLDDVFGWLMRP